MDKLQEYAEARRSGSYGGAQIGAQDTQQSIGPHFITEYKPEEKQKFPWLWTAINILVSLILIGLLIYMMKFMDQKDVNTASIHIQNSLDKVPTSMADFKTAFLDWAYTEGNILKVDCETRDKFGKSSEILTGCKFSFMETVDAAASKQNIKPL